MDLFKRVSKPFACLCSPFGKLNNPFSQSIALFEWVSKPLVTCSITVRFTHLMQSHYCTFSHTYLLNISDPVFDILKGFVICDVIYKHDALQWNKNTGKRHFSKHHITLKLIYFNFNLPFFTSPYKLCLRGRLNDITINHTLCKSSILILTSNQTRVNGS